MNSNSNSNILKVIILLIIIALAAFVIFKSVSDRKVEQTSMATTAVTGGTSTGTSGTTGSGGPTGVPLQTGFVNSISPLYSSCAPATIPWIQILSPNGGEIYTAGQQITVTWKSCNVSTSVLGSISLQEGSQGIQLTENSTPNTGSAVITIPPQGKVPSMVYGNLFKVQIIYPTYNTTFNGCSAGLKYSLTTGLPCNPPPTTGVAEGNSANLFAITPQLPPGCSSDVGYSTTNGLACYLETLPATSITSTSASLNGYLFPAGVSSTIVSFTMNPQPIVISGIPQATTGSVTTNVTGLTPDTKYQFQACSTNSCASWLSFTTLP